MPNFLIRESSVVRLIAIRRSAVGASDTTLRLAEDAHDRLSLCIVMLLGCASRGSLADFANRFSHNPGNLVLPAIAAWDKGARPTPLGWL